MSQVLAGHIAIIIGIIVLAYAFLVYRGLKALPEGNDKMRDIASAIHEGAMVFLKREYQIILIFVAIVFILLGISINFATAFAYLGGAACSILAGFFGMKAATHANVRTAHAAASEGQGKALEVAFKGGNVMGLSVAGLGLLGLSVAFFLGVTNVSKPDDAAELTSFLQKFGGIIGESETTQTGS